LRRKVGGLRRDPATMVAAGVRNGVCVRGWWWWGSACVRGEELDRRHSKWHMNRI
jgi:hypothetical protein